MFVRYVQVLPQSEASRFRGTRQCDERGPYCDYTYRGTPRTENVPRAPEGVNRMLHLPHFLP